MNQRPAPPDLLARLASQSLDDDYATVAARGGADGLPPARSRRVTGAVFGVSLAVLAVLLTVSVVRTRDSASQLAADREALISRIQVEQEAVGQLQQQVDDLDAEVDRLRTASVELISAEAAVEDRLGRLQVVTGSVPVSGPGVRITVDDAADGSPQGRVRDTDLQLLANGLWQAGAEAIAIGGQRLTTRSAIRTAGQAITVNYRSLSPPYVVTAIGDPETLPADFLETPAGQAFFDLRANFGIGFELQTPSALILPGRPLTVSRARSEPAPHASGVGP